MTSSFPPPEDEEDLDGTAGHGLHSPVLLALKTASPAARRLAVGAVLLSCGLFLATLPFAKLQLPAVHAFIPAYQSALALSDFITAVMLFGQYRILGHAGLRVLACGYLFTAFIAIAHALSFPGLVTPGGWLGAGPQSTAWLYMFWHAGFPATVIAYALLQKQQQQQQQQQQKQQPPRPAGSLAIGRAHPSSPWSVARSVAAVAVAVCLATALATTGQSLLPPIMAGNRYTPAMVLVVSAVWATSVAAMLLLLLRRRPYTVLDLLLMVAMCAWSFDVALSAVFNGGRFDLGFYAGRLYGLVAATVLLSVLLVENTALHARLEEAYRAERTKRRQIQRQSAELIEKNRELDAFAHSISHDLQAPLRAIQGFTHILLEEDTPTALDPEARRMLSVVDDNAKRMGQLIHHLLDFARLGRQPLSHSSVDMNPLVEQVIADLRQGDDPPQAEFSVAPLPPCWGDPALLRQVWANLLSNAVKYSPPAVPARIEVGAMLRDDQCIYHVADKGIGFDMRYADRLFELFQRLHTAAEFPGTGVGLSFVQRIVQRHGGRVWAEGAVNAGAKFSFSVPAGPGQ